MGKRRARGDKGTSVVWTGRKGEHRGVRIPHHDEYELTGGAAPDWKATIAASTYFCTHLFAAIFSGRGKEHGLEKEHLSWIVDIKNERFGLQLGDADQLLFDQLRESWAAAEKLPAPRPQQQLGQLPARA